MSENKSVNELTEATVKLQAIIENTIDGIITIDSEGIIQLVNQASSKLFGYSVDELIGQNVKMVMPSPHRENHDNYIHNYKETKQKKIIGIGREVLGLRKDGTTFTFWLAVSEIKVDDRVLFTGIIRDTSEQKKVEEEIIQLNKLLENKVAEHSDKLTEVVNKLLFTNQQLQHEIQERKVVENALKISQSELQKALSKEKELGELKSRFVATASHEFRTPLSTILSSASLMVGYTQTEQQPQREKHYHKIKNAVETLTNILNDFLSLSKLEEGKTNNNPEPIFINDFCEEVFEDLKGMLKRNQHVKQIHASNSVVNADKKLFKNVLYNLFSNAIKYSGENSTIYCSSKIEDKKLILSIKDEGIGIPAEEIHHLFDRFFRASNAGGIQGTGLGLNIVKRYMELIGGEISFESKVGEGTTFYLTFNIE